MVTIEYFVDAEKVPGLIKAINRYGRIRRRDGAYQWGIFRDLENAERYLETFLVDSGQSISVNTAFDSRGSHHEEQIQKHTVETIVRHLVYATANSVEHATDHNERLPCG